MAIGRSNGKVLKLRKRSAEDALAGPDAL